MVLYLGIDWDSKQLKIQVSSFIGKIKKLIIKEPSIKALEEAIKTMKELFSETKQFIAVIEAGAEQWNQLLVSQGIELYVVNPKSAKRFKESLQTSFAKDDFRDAKALLGMAKSTIHLESMVKFKIPSEQEQKITLLTKMHEELSSDFTKQKQQFRAYLRTKLPMIEKMIKKVDYKWVLDFFSNVPSLWALNQLTRERFDEILQGSKIRKTTKEELWLAILQSKQPWASKEMHEFEKMRTNGFISHLRELKNQLKRVNAKIDETLEQIPIARNLCKIGGLGSICTLALFRYGKLSSLKQRDDLAAILGASPIFIGSGNLKNGSPKGVVSMRRAVNNRAKHLTYTIGLLLTKHSKWAKAMFQYHKQKQKSSGTIFRQISRSFFRILSSMLRHGTEYNEELYIKRLKANGVIWAQKL